MELLDRYISAVGSRLPRKNRADIEAEIRSTLEDMIDDRSKKAGRPMDEALVAEVLKAYGSPEKVAATYQPERYLIGPRLYPIFMLVVKIVLIVLTVLALIGLGVGLSTGVADLPSLAKTVGRAFAEYFGSITTGLGSIMIVFAILERVLPAVEFESKAEKSGEWDPYSLPKEPASDAVGLWEPVLAIVFTVIAIVIFNFYPQIIGFTPSLNNLGNGPVVFIPLFSEAFFRYLPWLNLLCVLQIVMNLGLLRFRRWMPAIRLFSVALKGISMGIAAAMLQGPSLLGFTASDLTALNMSVSDAAVLLNVINQLVKVGLVVAIAGTGFSILVDLYKLVVRPVLPKPAV